MKEIEKIRPSGYLYSLKVNDLWSFFKDQDITYWLICGYLFFEYIRPQTLYPVLDILPFAQIIIVLNFFILLSRKNGLSVSSIGNKLLNCFFFVIFLSSVFALSPEVAFERLPDFIAWVLIYYLIINTVKSENRFLFFMLLFLLFSFKMAQFSFLNWFSMGFSFSGDGTGGGPGWFANSGEFGIQMCVFFPLSFYFFWSLKKKWTWWKTVFFCLFPLFALSGMISSSSRGAVVGGAITCLWILLKSKRKIIGLILLAIIIVGAVSLVSDEQKARFERAGSDTTSTNRIERWEKGVEMAKLHPALGVGFENWGVADKLYFSGSGAECHNVFVECVSELGLLGLFSFFAMIIATFRLNYKTRKVSRDNQFIVSMAHGLDGALVGYLVSGFFITVLYYPYFWINFALTISLSNIALSESVSHKSY